MIHKTVTTYNIKHEQGRWHHIPPGNVKEDENMAKRKSKYSEEKEERQPVSKKCQTPLKKQILEEINPDTIGHIARFFFAAGYEAGKRLDLSEKEKEKTLKQLMVKFREFINFLPDEVTT